MYYVRKNTIYNEDRQHMGQADNAEERESLSLLDRALAGEFGEMARVQAAQLMEDTQSKPLMFARRPQESDDLAQTWPDPF